MPIHWGTFNLALHAWDYPVETLIALARDRGIAPMIPQLGAPFEPSRGLAIEPWWRTDAERQHGATTTSAPSRSDGSRATRR